MKVQLTEKLLCIISSGKVLQLNVRGIPDYAIVPIDGYPVDKTVNSIVTNVWLVSIIHNIQSSSFG